MQVTSTISVPEEKSLEEISKESLAGQEDLTKDSYFDFTWARERYDKIINEWDTIRAETKRYRLLRYMKTDKATLEQLGLFKADEMYIAVRLIDQNIRAEQPQRLAYITQPRRSVVLKPLYGVSVNGLENVETVFTDCARYLGWEQPFIKSDDGASLHGWDFVEIVLDTSKPGHFAIEHVGHENLLFDLDSEDINAQEVVIRRLKWTASKLKEAIETDGFNKEFVDEILEKEQASDKKCRDITYDIYKCCFKHNGAIHVGYYGGEKTTGYLKKPTALYLGIDQPNPLTGELERLAETEYPFIELDYIESESPKVIEHYGRGFLDEPAQEGASAIMSGIVNGVMRASNVYGAPKPSPVPQADNAAAKQTDVKLQHGKLYDKPIDFFSTPYPPESAMQALEITTQYNRLDVSRPDYAVKNRKDSRKTATEIAASVNDASMQASVQSTQQSVFMRRVYTKCFEIFQNRALNGLLPIKDPVILQLLTLPVDIKAAGDVDVVQRQEKMQRQMQAWPVVSVTPIALTFLQDMLVNMFPEEAPKYVRELQQSQQAKQLVAGLASALQVAVTDNQGNIRPEFQGSENQLRQLEQQVRGFLQGQQNGQPTEQPATEELAA